MKNNNGFKLCQLCKKERINTRNHIVRNCDYIKRNTNFEHWSNETIENKMNYLKQIQDIINKYIANDMKKKNK